jgi:hypothetical protein
MLPYTRFCICLLDYDYVLCIVNFTILYSNNAMIIIFTLTKFFHVSIDHAAFPLMLTYTTVLAVGLSNGHLLIMPVIKIAIVFHVRVSKSINFCVLIKILSNTKSLNNILPMH